MSLSKLDELRSRWTDLRKISGPAQPDGRHEESLGELLQECVEAGRYTNSVAQRENLQWLARDIADVIFTLKEEYPRAAILPSELEQEPGAVPDMSQPVFKDKGIERLSTQLAELYAQHEQLASSGKDTHALDGKILDVRRLLRRGPQLQAGEFLLDGRLRLLTTLGKGDFATVWKAYDRQPRRQVAVKILHGQHSEDRSRRERFYRGARKMAELAHRNIVRVHEQRLQDDGWFFFVMELVTGGNFHQAVLDGELTDSEKLRIVTQVGRALEFAHERGVIHRDVKPTNIVLDGTRQPKLTDFDLVLAADSTGLTQTQAMLGTLNYAAPEALESPKNAGPAADVYALASTAIFALLGGQLPRGYYRDPAPAIASLKRPALARVLTRATAADPEQRFSSAGAFVSAINESTTPEPWVRRVPLEQLFEEIETPRDSIVALWRKIPAGEFEMGSPRSKGNGREFPRHRVEILSSFAIAATPVTNAQYAAFKPGMVNDASEPLHPVVNVSWHEALAFCEWLGQQFDWAAGARLPTEEEWEYACRAGTRTRYWIGDGEEDLARVGWYDENSGRRPHLVGEKPANPWGLYDVHGNVWEWNLSPGDQSADSKRASRSAIDPRAGMTVLAGREPGAWRVCRGGSFKGTALEASSACRWDRNPLFGIEDRGFRVLIPFVPSLALGS